MIGSQESAESYQGGLVVLWFHRVGAGYYNEMDAGRQVLQHVSQGAVDGRQGNEVIVVQHNLKRFWRGGQVVNQAGKDSFQGLRRLQQALGGFSGLGQHRLAGGDYI